MAINTVRLVEDRMKIQSDLETRRIQWEGEWEDVASLVHPRRQFMTQEIQAGLRVGEQIYDGTPTSALRIWATGMQGHMLGPQMEWFELRLSNRELNEIREVKIYLRQCAEEMYHSFRRSNFYDSIAEMLLDAGSVGTSTIYFDELVKEKTLNYSTRHPVEIYLAENSKGKVDTIHRKFKLEGRQLEQEYGKDAIPEDTMREIKQNPLDKYTVIHCVWPNTDYVEGWDTSVRMPWRSISILEAKKHLLKLSGYKDFPYACYRVTKSSQEEYGRSPAMDAIYDIIKLNNMNKTVLEMGHMAVAPPWNVPEELRGQVRYRPKGFNYYEETNRMIHPIHAGSQFPITLELLQDVRAQVKEAYQVDFFMMINRQDKQMTATEIIERTGEKAAILGTWVSRLASELLDPLVTGAFMKEFRAKRLPDMPWVLQDLGASIDIEYLGTLAQAQKRLFESSGIKNSVGVVVPLIEIMPNIADNFDWDFIGTKLASSYGMPPEGILPKKMVMGIRQQRQKQIEAQKAMEQAALMADAAPKLAKAAEPGSPLEEVQDAVKGGGVPVGV